MLSARAPPLCRIRKGRSKPDRTMKNKDHWLETLIMERFTTVKSNKSVPEQKGNLYNINKKQSAFYFLVDFGDS